MAAQKDKSKKLKDTKSVKSAKSTKSTKSNKSAKSNKKSDSKNPRQKAPEGVTIHMPTVSERLEQGKSFRDIVSRKSHAAWTAPKKRRNPMEILEQSNVGRFPELIPIRYGRMLKSPFTFFRGSAAIMAADLATTPATGIRVQACGDCHLLNFGAFGTPERNMIVDINDFDETLPAPWEWDIKRLATSFVLASRANGYKPDVVKDTARTVARSYREALERFAEMPALDVWYSKLDLDDYVKTVSDKELRDVMASEISKQRAKSSVDYMMPKLTEEKDGNVRFKDMPPLIFHSEIQRDKNFMRIARDTFETYKENLTSEKRFLLDRYTLMDTAIKVVGIGSVGTFCGVLLLMASSTDPLILQIKEARASVLEPYAGKSTYHNHGHRVVAGQRIMQAQTDIFLGWTTGAGKEHRHFYIRQLRDMKMSLVPEVWTPRRAVEVAEALGWVLARAHARSGDPALIAGYLGTKDVFEEAIADFAVAYADQTERDHQMLVAAVRSGKIKAIVER